MKKQIEKRIQRICYTCADGRLKFANTKVTTSLTFKYVEDVLTSCIKDENIKNELIETIEDNREVKYVGAKRYNTK